MARPSQLIAKRRKPTVGGAFVYRGIELAAIPASRRARVRELYDAMKAMPDEARG